MHFGTHVSDHIVTFVVRVTQYHHRERIERGDDVALLALKLLVYIPGAGGLVIWVYDEPMLRMAFQNYVD